MLNLMPKSQDSGNPKRKLPKHWPALVLFALVIIAWVVYCFFIPSELHDYLHLLISEVGEKTIEVDSMLGLIALFSAALISYRRVLWNYCSQTPKQAQA